MRDLKRLLLGKIDGKFHIFLLAQSILVTLFVFQIWIEAFYLGEPFEAKVGWLAEDGNGKTYLSGVGNHYFSDYSSMIESANEKNPWKVKNNYPPFAMFIFRIFSFFPPQFGLAVWLILSLLFLLFPLFLVSKRNLTSEQRIVVFLIYVISAPFLATLDRGNQIALLPFLLILFYICSKYQWNKSAGILLGLAVSIKIYPIILIIYLLRIRQWVAIRWTISTFILMTVLSSFYFSNSYKSIWEALNGITNHNYLASEPQPMIFSSAGLMHNLSHLILGPNSAITTWINKNSLVCALFVLVLVSVLSVRKYNYFSLLPYLYCLQLIPTQSYTYTRIWSLVALVILIQTPTCRLRRVWLMIVSLNMTPFAIWIQNEVNLLPTLAFFIFLGTIVVQIYKQVRPQIILSEG